MKHDEDAEQVQIFTALVDICRALQVKHGRTYHCAAVVFALDEEQSMVQESVSVCTTFGDDSAGVRVCAEIMGECADSISGIHQRPEQVQ